MEQPNEDLVIRLATTAGEMRIYPQGGLWTVEATNTDATGQAPITVTGVEYFAEALRMATASIYKPMVALDCEHNLKRRLLAEDGLEDYRAKAVANADQN